LSPPPQEALEGNGGQLSPGMVKQEEMETPTAPMRYKRSVTCPSFIIMIKLVFFKLLNIYIYYRSMFRPDYPEHPGRGKKNRVNYYISFT
jgi:hypothetical protein